MRREIFENPALYSQYLTYSGNRVNESGATMSIYIIEVQLKRTIMEMTCENMDEILNLKTKLIPIGLEGHQKRLKDKVETLKDWQLREAHRILDIGRIECVEFISKAKKTDKEIINTKKSKL